MPSRTKKTKNEPEKITPMRTKHSNPVVNDFIKEFMAHGEKLQKQYDQNREAIVQGLALMSQQNLLAIPVNIANKTIGQLRATSNATTNISSNLGSSTENTVEKLPRRLLRSISAVEISKAHSSDEGYLTAETSNNSNEARQSRTRERMKKNRRVSRSLSKQSTTKSKRFHTPLGKVTTPGYGTITPKMKPNVAQIILRRPKQGEVAVSMQGSPLLVSTNITDNRPTINIPMSDGRMYSVLALRGLCVSQLPPIDAATRRNLMILQDNFAKICSKAKK